MKTLFIAEDDGMMSRMYERAFRNSEHSLTMASNGEEALETLKDMKEKPVLILLDIMMPRMNGFDVLRSLKADSVLKNIPVILLSNLAGRTDAEKGLELGAEKYLVKSDYGPKEIVSVIEKFIEEHHLD